METLAQVVVGPAAGVGVWLIWVIIIAAAIAITVVILRAMGVALPPWFVHVLCIIAVAIVGVLAIKFLMSVL